MSSLADIVYLPRPRDIRPAAGSFFPRPGMAIALKDGAALHLPTARLLQDAAERYLGMHWPLKAGGDNAGIVLASPAEELATQHYRLTVAAGGAVISAGDAAGLFYGVMTLVQVMRESRGPLPAGTIVDGPDFPVRGVMLDISRDRVPTMETLFRLVDELSAMR
jgi:hexosaminidase